MESRNQEQEALSIILKRSRPSVQALQAHQDQSSASADMVARNCLTGRPIGIAYSDTIISTSWPRQKSETCRSAGVTDHVLVNSEVFLHPCNIGPSGAGGRGVHPRRAVRPESRVGRSDFVLGAMFRATGSCSPCLSCLFIITGCHRQGTCVLIPANRMHAASMIPTPHVPCGPSHFYCERIITPITRLDRRRN
jgi:hypothetical protein